MPSRVIVPLDFPSADQALDMTSRLLGQIAMVKIGLQLFCQEGPEVVETFSERTKVFLDLKLHDIPQTVARAVAAVRDLGASYCTVHASGGAEMLRAAVEAAGETMNIVAVTTLTSLDNNDLRSIGVEGLDTTASAIRLAVLAYQQGVRAFVCSPHEITTLRSAFGDEVELLVPGIRSKDAGDDQKRVATPTTAMQNGADYLIIGRPITGADDPYEALDAINKEVNAVLFAIQDL
jgi:orotidine-5'-phosphate decarboxylase